MEGHHHQMVTRSQRKQMNGQPRRTSPSAAAAAVPTAVPSIIELKKSLPSHCFSPSVLRSLFYVVKDFCIIGLLYLSMLAVEAWSPTVLINIFVAPVYWYLQVR